MRASRSDCYGLTTVGYMGNNVLPARAGEALRVVLLDQQTNAGKRKIAGTIVAERVLDVIVLAGMLVIIAYAILPGDVLPTDQPVLITGVGVAVAAVLAPRVPDPAQARRADPAARPDPPAARRAPAPWPGPRACRCWRARFVLWFCEGAVYLAVAKAVELDISATGALYLVALTNFAAALPAAPGSIGTFDAAVAFGARALGGSGSVVISYLLLLRFVLYVPITAVGLVFLVVRYGGWARLRSALSVQKTQASGA